MQSDKRPRRLDELDALRGILSLWVAAAHLFGLCGFYAPVLPKPLFKVWQEFISAQSAVEVFIILSGFVITLLLSTTTRSYREFMLGRFFRIYPVYIVCLLLSTALITLYPTVLSVLPWNNTANFDQIRAASEAERQYLPAHATWHVLLLHGVVPRSLLPNSTGTLLPPAWSITLEWQYYLVAPLIARLTHSRAGLLALLAAVLLGVRFGGPWQNPHASFLPLQLPLFLIGIASYHAYVFLTALPEQHRQYLLFTPILILMCALVASFHPISLTIWALVLGCLLLPASVQNGGAFPFLRRVLLNRFLQRLGSFSYPLYLVHWPLLFLMLFLVLKMYPTISRSALTLLMIGIGMPFILSVSYLLHRAVELPGMAWGKRVRN